MRRLLLISLMVCALAVSAIPAGAEPPTPASGDWTYVPFDVEIVKVAGQNTFIEGKDTGTWTGTFTGTSTEEFILVNHAKAGFNYYSGVIEFTGTVQGQSGTMVIRTNGKQDPGTVVPGPGLWEGSWVIVSGTGDLVNVHGQGTFTGPSLDLDYSGQIHFG